MENEQTQEFAWRRLEFAGITAVALVFGCLFVGQTAEHYADGFFASPPPQTAEVKPAFNAIDYATTGGLKSSTVIIGPCDAKTP